jgi:DNA-binding transcriptional LysR family regulator
VLRDVSLAGEGIVIHSVWHIAEDLRSGRLKVVLPDYPLATTAISAVMPQRRLVPPRVRAFSEFLIERFGQHPPWEQGLPI